MAMDVAAPGATMTAAGGMAGEKGDVAACQAEIPMAADVWSRVLAWKENAPESRDPVWKKVPAWRRDPEEREPERKYLLRKRGLPL